MFFPLKLETYWKQWEEQKFSQPHPAFKIFHWIITAYEEQILSSVAIWGVFFKLICETHTVNSTALSLSPLKSWWDELTLPSFNSVAACIEFKPTKWMEEDLLLISQLMQWEITLSKIRLKKGKKIQYTKSTIHWNSTLKIFCNT